MKKTGALHRKQMNGGSQWSVHTKSGQGSVLQKSHREKRIPTTPGHCPQRENPATAEKASHYTSDNFKKGSALNTGRKGEMEEGRQEACP